jgi:predicted phage tail protein
MSMACALPGKTIEICLQIMARKDKDGSRYSLIQKARLLLDNNISLDYSRYLRFSPVHCSTHKSIQTD